MKDAPQTIPAQKKSGMIALLGRPNVGKSSFLNAVLSEDISIVTPKAQTTRDQIRGILTEDRGQIVFVDTPGVHQAREGGINAFMIQEVRRAVEGSDVILYLIDPYSKPEAEEILLPVMKAARAKLVVVVNKADRLPSDPERFRWLDTWIDCVQTEVKGTECEYVKRTSMSALSHAGVQDVVTDLYDLLPVGPYLFSDEDAATDRSTRFVVSELIRKQLFMCLGDELPYSCAVEILSYQENKKPIVISAQILVERDSQKGMVIGAGGKKIKEIGSQARTEIEQLVGEKVFLELNVKVLDSWTSDMHKMKQLGYALERKK